MTIHVYTQFYRLGVAGMALPSARRAMPGATRRRRSLA